MIAILGGGLSGLQLGRRLRERGLEFLILEGKPAIGGLCRTLTKGDYSWDLGPHGFYSKDPKAVGFYRALPLQYESLDRNVRVCHRDGDSVYEVGYPFENGLAELPPRHRLECVAGYCWASWTRSGRPFRHLRHWIEDGLGRGIARRFMMPYNEKIWSVPLERISMDLVNNKIEPEKPWTIVRNSLRGGTVGRAYQAKFLYPAAGAGAGAVCDAVAASIADRIRTGVSVLKLERRDGRWLIHGRDGPVIEAETVVSTIPIPELLDALGDGDLSSRRADFAYNDTVFMVIGLKRGADFARFRRCQWVFFAGPEVFYRISLMNNFSSGRLPTLVAEVTRKGPETGLSPEALTRRVLRDLRETGILPGDESVAMVESWLERYTYPIQTVGLAEARDFVERRLAERRLFLLGRMGRWEYINTDGVFLRVDDFLARRGADLRPTC